MKKRIVALLLALVMAVGLVMPASAEGLDGATTFGGDGAPVVITGDGVTTPPPADTDTPTTGDSTPTTGDSTTTPPTTTPPAAPVDGEDEDESDTPMPLAMASPMSVGAAPATESVQYVDENGVTRTVTATVVKDSTAEVTWGSRESSTPVWYVVNDDVAINDTVTVAENSDVHLILADGATLTVNGEATETNINTHEPILAYGICLLGNLTIYAQSATGENIGKLIVTAEEIKDDFSSGIRITSVGSLTINGGVINATGGAVEDVATWTSSSYGICAEGPMTINGGTVTATGGEVSGSVEGLIGSHGIYVFNVDNAVTIKGGEVTATGYKYGVGGGSAKFESGTLIAKGAGTSGKAIETAPTLPATYYWRTAASGEGSNFTPSTTPYTHNDENTYVELTTQPSGGGYLSYKDWDAVNKKLVDAAIATASVTQITASTSEGEPVIWSTASNTTWYYVSGDVSISQTVKIRGDVHLILCDGAKLTVTENNSLSSGIDISQIGETTGSLTIYGQSAQTGALESTANNFHGIQIIGGSSLTINGGHVTGTSASQNIAHNGIHVGNEKSKLTVNSGTLIAKTTKNKSAAMKIESGKPDTPAGTLNLPTTYWWRMAETGDSAKYKTQNRYTVDALGGTYFELTTTQPADDLLDRVGYLDWNAADNKLDTTLTYCEGPTEVAGNYTWGKAGEETWYYVKARSTDNLSMNGTVTVKGTVNLILCDGADLTVIGGIEIKDGASLTIYGQSAQTGKLTASAGSGSSGINVYCSSLTVNGGVIQATGGTLKSESNGIGIYGSLSDPTLSSSMTVNSGKVTATGNTFNDGDSNGIKLHNGTPTLTINGGEVEAIGGEVEAIGGEVTGTTGDSYGINNGGGTVTINDGEVTATGGEVTSGRSHGIRNSSTMTITGGEVTATGGTGSSTYGIYNNYAAALTITGGKVIAKRAAGGSSSSKAVYLFEGDQSATLKLPTIFWWRADSTATTYKTQNRYTNSALEGEYFELTTTEQTTNVQPDPAIPYVDASGEAGSCNDYTVLRSSDDDVTLTGGWYVVNSNVTIDGTLTIAAGSDVHLILCNGATLTVNKGVVSNLEGSGLDDLLGYSLTIYGQAPKENETTGKLVAYDAGLSDDISGGIIVGALTINGGEVTANGFAKPTEGLTIRGNGPAISTGAFAVLLSVNGGKLTATGGTNASTISCGILGIIMSVNGQPSRVSVLGIEETEEEDENEAVVAAAPEIEGVGGDTTGDASIGIFSFFMAVDGVNIGEAMMQDSYDLAEDDPTTDSTTGSTTGSTCSAKITAMGGTAEREEVPERAGIFGEDPVSCGMFTFVLHVGVSLEDIMGGDDDDGPSILGEDETETDAATASNGSTAQINATGDDVGMMVIDLFSAYGGGIPAVWLNGGTLTATGATSGIAALDIYYLSLDTFGLLGVDTFGIDTYGNEDENENVPTVPTVYVQKGTLIADATGTGLGLDLGNPVNGTVPLTCPAEYWWRINKAVNGYTKYPTKAYSYTGQHDYVEITTDGEGLPLLPEPEKEMPLPGPDGSKHQPIRRQNNAVAALVPSTGKTDVESPETFDAGIALYVGLGVLSLTGSAAWVGKRKKW